MIKDLKTPLRYPGGKSRATKTIFSEQRLPNPEFHDIHEYREMFLGGGSCAFYFSQLRPDVPVWVNDKYTPLYHFWKVLQEDGVRLMYALKECKERLGTDIEAHRKVFLDAKESLQEDDDPFNLATAFYLCNKMSFSGLSESSSFSKQASQQNFTLRGIEKLPRYSKLMENWKITNEDYTSLLEGADQNTFIFADPPYDIKSFVYGKDGDMHKTFDHKRFHDDIDQTNAMVMITYNSNETLREAYFGWEQEEWDLTYTMRSTKKYTEDQKHRKELLLTNYRADDGVFNTLEDFFHE